MEMIRKMDIDPERHVVMARSTYEALLEAAKESLRDFELMHRRSEWDEARLKKLKTAIAKAEERP